MGIKVDAGDLPIDSTGEHAEGLRSFGNKGHNTPGTPARENPTYATMKLLKGPDTINNLFFCLRVNAPGCPIDCGKLSRVKRFVKRGNHCGSHKKLIVKYQISLYLVFPVNVNAHVLKFIHKSEIFGPEKIVLLRRLLEY